jgi:5-methylcytosine-specific restriction endonuclease McrA
MRALEMADDVLSPKLPIITRAEAKAAGLKYYFTGKPCHQGHLAERLVSRRQCYVCAHGKPRKTEAERAAARAATRERNRLKNRARYTANPQYWADRGKQKRAARTADERERDAESFRSWYLANKEKVSAKSVAWANAHPEEISAQRRNSRARRRAAEGTFSAKDIQRIIEAQKGKCAICREKVGDKFQVDHITPIAKGGSNWPKNLQVVCRSCNGKKHARDPIKHMQSLGFLL